MAWVRAAGGSPAAAAEQHVRLRTIGPELPQGLSHQFPDKRVFADRPHRGDRLAVGQAGLVFLSTPVLVEGDEEPLGCGCVRARPPFHHPAIGLLNGRIVGEAAAKSRKNVVELGQLVQDSRPGILIRGLSDAFAYAGAG